MHFTHCEHPIRVYNKYLNAYIYVPCRKCNSCRNIYTFQWAQRIKTEMLFHEFNYHITLQFDDDHVPCLYKVGNKLVSKEINGFDDYIVIKIPKTTNQFNKDYYEQRTIYPYGRKREFQLFFKRLRKAVTKLDKDAKVRYVVALEYGPKTFRPHGHCILFSDSPIVHKAICKLVRESWKYGFAYVRRCSKDDKASGYVAKYVVRPTDCPEIYQNNQIQPFFLCSKCPPIGSATYTNAEIVETLYKGTPFKSHSSDGGKTFNDIPLSRYCENYLFPKLKSYDKWNFNERNLLYGIYKEFGCCNWKEFRQRCLAEYHKKSFYRRYIAEFMTNSYDKEYNSLKNLWFQSKRVFDNCICFGLDLRTYVRLIDQYYNNKQMYKLKKQIAYEKKYLENLGGHPIDLLSLDRTLCFELKKCLENGFMPKEYVSILSQFDDFDLYSFEPDDTLDSKSLKVGSSKISHDMSKNKYANDHFELKRFKTTINHFNYGRKKFA